MLTVFDVGVFIYPLEECSTVVGFEAMISNQIITVQIKDKSKIDDCYFDCCTPTNGALQSGSGKDGSRVKCCGQSLCSLVPDLFALSCQLLWSFV